MRFRNRLAASIGLLLFLAGVLVSLTLSAGVLWGEIEAILYASRTAEGTLGTMKCPLMLAENEPGVVAATFTNSTTEPITATINSEISHIGGARETSEFVPLAEGETKELRWSVGAEDLIFKRLILANVFSSYQHKLPSRRGTCGILVLALPSLTGFQSFQLAFALSTASIILGGALWSFGNRPLAGWLRRVSQAGGTLAAFALGGMISAIPRWWGLTGFFIVGAMLLIMVIVTDFVLFPSAANDE